MYALQPNAGLSGEGRGKDHKEHGPDEQKDTSGNIAKTGGPSLVSQIILAFSISSLKENNLETIMTLLL